MIRGKTQSYVIPNPALGSYKELNYLAQFKHAGDSASRKDLLSVTCLEGIDDFARKIKGATLPVINQGANRQKILSHGICSGDSGTPIVNASRPNEVIAFLSGGYEGAPGPDSDGRLCFALIAVTSVS